MALDVLKLMPGKKIIVTPGMIELGDREYELNMKFGKHIAEVCDEVILVGKEQTKPIYDGLIDEGFKEKNIHIINDVKIAFDLMILFYKDVININWTANITNKCSELIDNKCAYGIIYKITWKYTK